MSKETINRKQNMFDFMKAHAKLLNQVDVFERENGKQVKHQRYNVAAILDEYRELIVIKYKTPVLTEVFGRQPFIFTLTRDNFPNRNLVPVYGTNEAGKYEIVDYIQGEDAIPSPTLQRFLDTGERHYIPDHSKKEPITNNPADLLSAKAIAGMV